MKRKIIHRSKDPLGAMLLDYLNGDSQARVQVESTTLDMIQMKGCTLFRSFKNMNRIERKALSLCRGAVLDIGAGSGCHSLYLQKKGRQVDALDISPGCVAVMEKRQVKTVIHDSLFSLDKRSYDTLLMLMNGLGICGSLDGLNLFFQFIPSLLRDGGQVIADSTDLLSLYTPQNLPSADQGYYGQTEFIMTYKEIVGDPFEWLYIDFDTLAYHAGRHGFTCERLMTDSTGKYLARIS